MMQPKQVRFCPYDGTTLVLRTDPKSKALGTCPTCKYAYYGNPVAGVALFLHEDGKILLAKRAVEPRIGKWDIPGGFVEGNESGEDAVVREAEEETNLIVSIEKFLGSVPDVYGDHQVPTLNLIYVGNRISGDQKAQDDVEELRWFRLDELPNEMAFAHQVKAVEMLREYLAT